MAEHNKMGVRGENLAVDFLIKNGYKILETGWRYIHLELDVICSKDNFLVVIEVKTRSNAGYADPDSTISNKKLRKIYDATEKYMELYKVESEVRYDLITIIDHGDSHTVEHIEDAFYPFMQ